MWIVLRCDLLENSYFCSIANNNSLSNCTFITVVICLKTRTFAVSQTTVRILIETKIPLWFAWKLVLLQYRKQPLPWSRRWRYVVICLKTRTFAVSQTTITSNSTRVFSCDLLENSYFCSIANNHWIIMVATEIVVICLKTRTFAVSQTTHHTQWETGDRLWFAWKLVLLQYRKQPEWLLPHLGNRCDLLENSYFCSIANNDWRKFPTYHLLWFAWKLVLLQYRKQHD